MIVAAHAAAAACLWLVLPGFLGVALGGSVLALGAASAWARGLLAAPGSPQSLELVAPDAVVLVLRDGRRVRAVVGEGRWVARGLVGLPLRAPVRRTLLVSAGMLGAEPFRLLRVWSLWGRVADRPDVASGQLPA